MRSGRGQWSRLGVSNVYPYFFLKTRREKRNIKNSVKKSLSPCNPCVFSFFFTFLENDSNYAAYFCFFPPSFDPPFTPVLFSFFFSHFLLSLFLSLRRFPRVKIDTRLSNVHYVPKATLSSVIFFGVTDNNMAYNRIGIMPVALRPDTKSRILLWHIARSYVCRAFSIVSWCINSRSRLISTEFSLFQPGKEKKKGGNTLYIEYFYRFVANVTIISPLWE